jgi:hypothetical protein
LKISPFFSVKNICKTNDISHCKLCWKNWICQPVTSYKTVEHTISPDYPQLRLEQFRAIYLHDLWTYV